MYVESQEIAARELAGVSEQQNPLVGGAAAIKGPIHPGVVGLGMGCSGRSASRASGRRYS
jgi:hypothetical protein